MGEAYVPLLIQFLDSLGLLFVHVCLALAASASLCDVSNSYLVRTVVALFAFMQACPLLISEDLKACNEDLFPFYRPSF